jgi:hypothetical protein
MMTPFHAALTAHEISYYARATDRLVAAFASANIEVYPYQIAAAQFALRSEYLKGVILADEGGLGKSMEALLVLSQLWFEGKERILLVVPTPLLAQWAAVLERYFAVPFAVVGRENPDFAQEGIILTTYEIAADLAEQISGIIWHVAAFEEAHRLNKPENKATALLKSAVGGAFKVLLTATPMQNSIMDLYGLIAFIDETVLPDAEDFYKRYFRKPERYGELTAVVSRYAFRTLRAQAQRYVNLPNRMPVTADYKQTAAEVKLAAMVEEYLKKPEKAAFPKMDGYECALMFWKALSSSTTALLNLLEGTLDRTDELREMRDFAAGIKVNAKSGELVKALKRAFAELKKRGANHKALIFTEYKATQKHLAELLSCEYSVTTDYDKFADAEILITTDVAAEGFNFEFCSFIVNYDLPYTVLTLEQRIMRCHRQGQKNDVVVLNFLAKANFADVRMLELINKRVLQFDGIMGLSDDLVGNFCDSAADGVAATFANTRTQKQIETDYAATLQANEGENAAEVERAENALFTTFTRDIAEKVTVTPQYVKQRVREINDALWNLTRYFFENAEHGDCRFEIDEQARTITAIGELPRLFYYWTGGRSKPYSCMRKYGMAGDFKPASGRITLTSVIGRGVLSETAFADSGKLVIDADVESCEIGLYGVKILKKREEVAEYSLLTGKTADGTVLSDENCRKIMALPVVSFTEDGTRSPRWLRESTGKPRPDPLDGLIDPAPLIKRTAVDWDELTREEARAIQDRAYYRKQGLNRDIEALKTDLRQTELTLTRTGATAEKLLAEKRHATANKALKQREQSLFMAGIKIDGEAEATIAELTANAELTADVTRLFAINIVKSEEHDNE